MKDEMPTPYPVWPKMGFQEWFDMMEGSMGCCSCDGREVDPDGPCGDCTDKKLEALREEIRKLRMALVYSAGACHSHHPDADKPQRECTMESCQKASAALKENEVSSF